MTAPYLPPPHLGVTGLQFMPGVGEVAGQQLGNLADFLLQLRQQHGTEVAQHQQGQYQQALMEQMRQQEDERQQQLLAGQQKYAQEQAENARLIGLLKNPDFLAKLPSELQGILPALDPGNARAALMKYTEREPVKGIIQAPGDAITNPVTGQPIATPFQAPKPVLKAADNPEAVRRALAEMRYKPDTDPSTLSGTEAIELAQRMDRFAGAGAGKTTVDLGEKEFAKGLGQINAQLMKDSVDMADAAVMDKKAALDALTQLKMMRPGAGAGVAQSIGEALVGAGLSHDPSVAATQNYLLATGQRTLAILKSKALGSGNSITDNDRAFARQLAGGDYTLTPETLQRTLELAATNAQVVVDAHNRRVQLIRDIPEDQRQLMLRGEESPPPRPAGQIIGGHVDANSYTAADGKTYPVTVRNGKRVVTMNGVTYEINQ